MRKQTESYDFEKPYNLFNLFNTKLFLRPGFSLIRPLRMLFNHLFFSFSLTLILCLSFLTEICLMFLQGAILTTILATSNFNLSSGIITVLLGVSLMSQYCCCFRAPS